MNLRNPRTFQQEEFIRNNVKTDVQNDKNVFSESGTHTEKIYICSGRESWILQSGD